MLTEAARGVYVIAVTPFDESGRVDEASVDRMVEFYRDCGVTGLTILGMMGEAPKLDTEEALGFVAAGRQARRQAAGHRRRLGAGLRRHAHAARSVMDAGAAGVMIAPPASVRTDDQIVGYFEQARRGDRRRTCRSCCRTIRWRSASDDARRHPPHRRGASLLRDAEARGLAGPREDHCAARLRADGSMRPISILTGNGGLFLDFEMERGADGAMTGYAFPDMLVDVVRLQRAGKRDAAHDSSTPTCRCMRYEQQPGIGLAVRKYVLKRRGAIASRCAAQSRFEALEGSA